MKFLLGETEVEWTPWDHPGGSPMEAEVRQEYKRFKPFIKSGDFVVDIGAHIGDTTLPMGILAGKLGRVLAFEPNPLAFAALQRNVMRNKRHVNVEAYCAAVMPKSGDYTFHYTDASYCNGGLSGKSETTFPLTVTGIRLDEYITSRNIALIKLDTEGMDHVILRSITPIILRDKPVIMAEVFSGLSDEERLDYCSVVNDLGYMIGLPERQEKPTPDIFLARYSSSVDALFTPANGEK